MISCSKTDPKMMTFWSQNGSQRGVIRETFFDPFSTFGALGRPGSLWGAPWVTFGCSWVAPGSLLGLLWGPLGLLWVPLASTWAAFGGQEGPNVTQERPKVTQKAPKEGPKCPKGASLTRPRVHGVPKSSLVPIFPSFRTTFRSFLALLRLFRPPYRSVVLLRLPSSILFPPLRRSLLFFLSSSKSRKGGLPNCGVGEG